MENTKKWIGIDMDEVIADTLGALLDRYNADFAMEISKADLMGIRFWEKIPKDRHAHVIDYFTDGEIFADLPVFEDSVEVIRELQDNYEVFITTAAMEVPSSFNAKFRWLERHFPFIPASHIVFCGDKSVLAVDYLIDDNTRHFRRLRGEGIVFTAPHNIHETGFRRVDNWIDVRRMFLS